MTENKENAMGKTFRFLMLCFIMLAASVLPAYAAGTATITFEGTQDYTEAREVLKYTNQIRAEKGLPPLVMDEELTENAMQRAAEIELEYSHIRPDGSECFTAITSDFSFAAENIAFGQETPYEVTRGKNSWEHSAGHYRNITSSRAKAIGIGVFYTADGVRHWVQLFTDKVGKKCTKTGRQTAVYSIRTKRKEFKLEVWPDYNLVLDAGDYADAELYVHREGHPGEPMGVRPLYVSSSDPTIVQVTAGGRMRGVSKGSAVIRIGLNSARYKTVKVTVLAEDEYEGVRSMYRMYNPNSGEHFYTADAAERNALIRYGWHYEGIGWYAPEESEIPVYRLYNASGGDHHYTVSTKERDTLMERGWKDEGIGWYSDENMDVPLYRQYNPNAFSCNHNYTADKNENDALISLGWKGEGISWYGIDAGRFR